MIDAIHHYELAKGHGLAHDPSKSIVGFSSIGGKDSLRNIEATGEFCWNRSTLPLAEAMNVSCAGTDRKILSRSSQSRSSL